MEVRGNFEAAAFRAELKVFLEAWRASWCYPDSGPQPEGSEFFGFQQIPTRETQAYRNLLEYASSAILVATQLEQVERVLKAMERGFGDFLGECENNRYYIKFLRNVFATTLNIYRKRVNSNEDRIILGLMEAQRNALGQNLGFGFLAASINEGDKSP